MKTKRQWVILAICLAAVGLPCLTMATWIVVSGLRDDLHKADLAVVLGNEVLKSGQPSARLRARLDRAVELYQAGLTTTIVVSGGLGKSGYEEATVMRLYLLQNKIPAKSIIEDRGGVNTAATARNVARIMRERGMKSATVVTQYFHIARCRLAFKQAGIAPVYSAHARFFEVRDLYATAREVVAYIVYLLPPAR